MKFFAWCKRYMSLLFVIMLGLYAYILFFDENSFGNLAELNQQIDQLNYEIKQNTYSMEYYRALNHKLQSSPIEIERVAREKYFMQGPGEDVYVIEKK